MSIKKVCLLTSVLALFSVGCGKRAISEAPAAQAPTATNPATASIPAPVATPPAPTKTATSLDVFEIKVAQIAKKKTLGSTLLDMGVVGDELNEVLAALKSVFDFRKSRVGDQVRVTRIGDRVNAVEYRSSAVEEWLVQRQGERLLGVKRPVEIEKKIATVDIAVNSSLYESMTEAGEDPSLAVEIADVFAWDMDFYRDVRKGDRLRIVVEKQFARGKLLKYGDILGVRYEGSLVGSRRLLRYVRLSGDVGYFDNKGNSAKKSFLKSPLKYVRITSHYGGRTNPISGFHQQHLGVDFSAELGTPVWAVADGVVSSAIHGDRGGGNFVFLKHANGLETGYLHLSRFAEGIHVGTRVKQKQVIAYTGNTGLSTGPHLHYAMKRGGQYINPLSLRVPRADPLPNGELSRFEEQTASIAALLNADFVAMLDRSL